MSETVVHVTTLEQWKSVLDVWFKQGYSWYETGTEYNEWCFRDGERYLLLDDDNDIVTPSHFHRKITEYSEFMAQQKEDKEVKTYYVTKEQLELIENLGEYDIPFFHIVTGSDEKIKNLAQEIPDNLDKPILRYLGGDETIKFNVKEQLYRLSRLDKYGDTVYFTKKWGIGNPVVSSKNYAFTAPLDEIKKWQTPAWEIEKAD